MKKITFLAFLLVSGITHAQTYCSIDPDYEDIEEITAVNFGTTSITNTTTTSVLVDFTSTVANVNTNQAYTLVVKGNSYGDYDNEYTAYIDWNHNGVLNDPGEQFYIGKITNSTGYDTKTASTSITVPVAALTGNTRIRIVKVYTDSGDDYILNPDPCYISIEDIFFGSPGDVFGSYGQALDFTLNVSALANSAFSKDLFTLYPNPARDILNIESQQNVDEVSIYNLQGQLVENSKNSNQIHVGNLPTGQYFIKVSSGGLFQTNKFVKE